MRVHSGHQGARHFDELLLDADWSLNNGNWMWLSCSAYFHQYFRCYSPVVRCTVIFTRRVEECTVRMGWSVFSLPPSFGPFAHFVLTVVRS